MPRSYNMVLFCQDHGIDYEQGSRGYIEIQCPLCDDQGRHGGFHPSRPYTCWKCGNHGMAEVVTALTGMDWYRIRDRYEIRGAQAVSEPENVGKPAQATRLVLPREARGLASQHRRYLRRRGFDPDHLVSEYKIMGTGPLGEYKHRIIIPVIYKGEMVSFISRDWTGLAHTRYKSCRKEDEVIHHKDILYNLDNCRARHAVIVEGATDVWRLGPGSCATLGTGFTQAQVNLIAQRFSEVTLIYDAEAEAWARAQQLGGVLAGLGIDVHAIKLSEGDPGSMGPAQAKTMMEEVLGHERL